MNSIKLGGGHYICSKCGVTVFGSVIHRCENKIDYWKQRREEIAKTHGWPNYTREKHDYIGGILDDIITQEQSMLREAVIELITQDTLKEIKQLKADKAELLEALKLCKEAIKRYANFNSSLMDEDDKARVKLFDDELDQLLQKHQKQSMLSEAEETNKELIDNKRKCPECNSDNILVYEYHCVDCGNYFE